MPEKKQKKLQQSQRNLSDYARYSGIAFQMIVVILAGVYFGKKMDGWFETTNSIFTAVFSLLGVILAIYFVIKDLIKSK
ncbi:MAG: AtpZ/AtpI family protein [Bacteroidales bacterium]